MQVPALACMLGICSQPPGSTGGKVSWRKLKSCLLWEQVKTSTVSRLGVHKRYGMYVEREFCTVAKRIDLEKLESLIYEAAQKRTLLTPSFVRYHKDSALSLLWTAGYMWWKVMNNLETKEEKISFKQPGKEQSPMSALVIEVHSRNNKFSTLFSAEELLRTPHSHPFVSCIYVDNGSHLMDRLSLCFLEKSWQADRMSSGTTHYLPHTAVQGVEICPVEGGLQCSGCYSRFLFFLERGRVLFWLRAKAAALSIPG